MDMQNETLRGRDGARMEQDTSEVILTPAQEISNIVYEYAKRGWHVFPIHGIKEDRQCTCGKIACPDAGKHPATRNGLKDATCDEAKLREMFADDRYNIGVRTGKVSGITVIDIDVGDGKLGAETWQELIAEHGEPNTLMSKTGSGGMHVFFKYNAALKTGTNTLGKGVDVRNDSGYVVVPPSSHRSGGTYEWLNEGTPLDDLPEYLLEKKKETRGRKPRQQKLTIEQAREMLNFVSSDDRDTWRNVGIILGREFNRSEEAWALYNEWSDKWGGKKGRNHDEIMREAFYEVSQDLSVGKEMSMGTIVHLANEGGYVQKTGDVDPNEFVYVCESNSYIYRPTNKYWIAAAVDTACSPKSASEKASDWIKKNRFVTSIARDATLGFGYAKGKECVDGEIEIAPAAALYNLYKCPTIKSGDAALASPFVEHVRKVFNKDGDADQFLDYMAHRVQKPWEKPRFSLLIAGDQGVGKDTAVEFCVPAIGAWNVANIDPAALDSGFNEYAASTLLRVSEAANLQDISKWAFNERMKVLIGGSPDICTVNPKYGQKYTVKMFCGVIITTNHLGGGIYIPQGDRRYDVIEAATRNEMGFATDDDMRNYFAGLWPWFNEGGGAHVAAFLRERDISKFSPNNGQRKTEAHKTVVASGLSTDEWLNDILEQFGWPDAVRSDSIIAAAVNNEMKDSDARKMLSKAITRAGYIWKRNPDTSDGRWRKDGKKFMVFVTPELAPRFRLTDVPDEKF